MGRALGYTFHCLRLMEVWHDRPMGGLATQVDAPPLHFPAPMYRIMQARGFGLNTA